MSNAVIFNGDYVKALKSKLKLGESANIETGSQDPSTLSLSSPLGSLYLRSNGTVYIKYGAAASAWAPALTTGTGTVLKNTFLEDNSVAFADNLDNSKKLYFELSGISTNTSRTLTIPDTNGSIVLGSYNAGQVTYWAPSGGNTLFANPTGNNQVTISSSNGIAYTFTASGSGTVSSISVKLLRASGTFTGNVRLAIWSTSGGNPSAELEVSPTILAANSISSLLPENYIFSFSSTSLVSGTKYAVAIYCESVTGGNVFTYSSSGTGENWSFRTTYSVAPWTFTTAIGNGVFTITSASAPVLISEAQLSPSRGGTGVNNTGLLTYGNNNITLTTSGVTALTLPTSGTVATLAGAENLSNKTINSSSIGITTASSAAFTFLTVKGTGVAGTSYLDLLNESVDPASPNTGYTRFYAKNNAIFIKDNLNNISAFATLAASQTFTGNNTISVNNASDAFKIIQTGAGNSLVVESGSPALPFVIKNTGKVIVGHTQPLFVGSSTDTKPLEVIGTTEGTTGLSLLSFSSSVHPKIILGRTNGSIIGDYSAVIANQTAGELIFAGSDNTNAASQLASIAAVVQGTVSSGSIPGRIEFRTTGSGQFTPTNRFTIFNTGAVTVHGLNSSQGGEIRLAEDPTNGINYVGFKAPNSIASDISWTLPASDGLNGQTLSTNGAGVLSWSTAGNTIAQVTQSSHGFVAADIGRPLYLNGSVYALARADAANTAEVVGLIYSIIDTNSFQLCLIGDVASVGANLVEGGGPLITGETYFLSSTTAGKITITEPSVVGAISKPIGVARSSSVLNFFNMRGSTVGGANARTQISLINNGITTVQSVSQYLAGELVGWIYIDGTTDYRFYVQAQFTKNGTNTDYVITFQTLSDVPPPLGFNITITNLGLIQVTLPNIPGFVSADINFALNAPAIGNTFPLSVPGSSILSNYKTVSGAYTIVPTDYYVSATGSSAYTISLPSAASVSGKMFIVKSRLNAGLLLTIATSGSETIDGSLTINLFQNESCFLVSNGTSWEMF